MGTPSAQELTLLRQEVNKWMPDLCDIHRISTVDDSHGGEDVSELVIAEDVICQIESGAGQEELEIFADRLRNVQIFTVALPYGTDIQLEDHLFLTTKGNLHLRVQAVLDPESWQLERRVIASEEGEHNA